MGMWNGIRLNAKLDAVNLDKLVKIGQHAFNHAAKEKRKALTKSTRGKSPYAVPTLKIDSPGAEFFVWNEANALVHCLNCDDPWYNKFYEAHMDFDVFMKKATEILEVRERTKLCFHHSCCWCFRY